MVRLHLLSPDNEVAAARRLEALVKAAWPEVAASTRDHVDLIVGIRTGLNVDLLVALELSDPRTVPGKNRPADAVPSIASGLIAVEIKQLDPTSFVREGNQLFPVYGGRRETRSVVVQARDAAYALRDFAVASGVPLFVHALAWLTSVDPIDLRDADPDMLAGNAGWREFLLAAIAQNPTITRADESRRRAVAAVRTRLLNRRTLTVLDRTKCDAIARKVVLREFVDGLVPRCGSAMVRLSGHGGSGKTTALIMLATRLARDHARVLILSFHQTLCGDIRHALRGLSAAEGLPETSVCVETATTFLMRSIEALGFSVPTNAAGAIDYQQLHVAYSAAAEMLASDADGTIVEVMRLEAPEHFGWDHVFIDEAQDWSDAERDIVLALFGHKRIVLADGLVQLIRRQTRCDWIRAVPKLEREQHILGKSLRMQQNIAAFANAVASAVGLPTWKVEPHDELPGGRVVVLEGELVDDVAIVTAIGAVAARGKARSVDNLICVPPSQVSGAGAARVASIATHLRTAGAEVWDASNAFLRSSEPANDRTWRIVQYDSCRGLEGWATFLVALDDLYANKLKHPNVDASEAHIDAELIARRWLLIPLTRAVHLLVVHIRDPRSPLAAMLREAAALMPRGTVEWCPAAVGAARIDPSRTLE